MCGINGIYNIAGLSDPKALIKRMNKSTQYRGPDHSDTYHSDTIALGHNRLAIIDLDEKANQPFISEDGNTILVFNGEIYNYKEIKEQLNNYLFTTNSDTEVVMAAYLKWGAKCIHHFNGMFAFAVWDVTKHELFIARDRLGIKPLYYYDNGKHMAFSSAIKSLLTLPFVDKKLDKSALVDYVMYGTVHAPRTIVKNIKMLQPGHTLTLSDNGIEVDQYWDINKLYSKESEKQDYEEVKQGVKDRFTQSIKRRLIADVPFGAFLSGGIDSSAIVGKMAEVSAAPIKTFTVTFDEAKFSEAKYAQMIADKFATEHTAIKLTPEDFLKELPMAISALDHPSGDGPNSYVVAKATKDAGVTMAVSGVGGDEFFAGYAIFSRAYTLQNKKWLNSLPFFLRKALGTGLKTIRPSIASDKIAKILLSKYIELPYYYPINREVLDEKEIRKLLSFRNFPLNAVKEIVSNGVGAGTIGATAPLLSQVSYAEINTYLQNILLRDTDQMSMAHALEVRTPFLDHELVEYVYGIRDELKYPHSPKKLLVDALGDTLPSEIVNRPKMGFSFPWEQWMKQQLKPFCVEGIHSLESHEAFEKDALKSLWNDFLSGKKYVTWSRVWHLVVLGHWVKQNIDCT